MYRIIRCLNQIFSISKPKYVYLIIQLLSCFYDIHRRKATIRTSNMCHDICHTYRGFKKRTCIHSNLYIYINQLFYDILYKQRLYYILQESMHRLSQCSYHKDISCKEFEGPDIIFFAFMS
jgi:hypothetical protein